MKIRYRYLQYDSHLDTITPVKAILDKYLHPYNYKEDLECVVPTFKYTLEFFLYENSPEFDAIKAEISKFIEPQIVGTEYEKADVKNAEWFIVSTGEYQYPQPEEDFGYLKASFNLDNYCHLCGIGKVQNSEYRLRTIPKQLTNQFWGLHWEYDAIFVREETKKILEREGIQGIRLKKAKDRK